MMRAALLLTPLLAVSCMSTSRLARETQDPFVPFAEDTVESREPARADSLDPSSSVLRYTPFFIEAAPQKMDPRRGRLENLQSPIPSEILRAAMAEGFYPILADLTGIYFSGTVPLDKLLPIVAQHVRDSLIRAIDTFNDELPNEPQEYSFVLFPWEYQDRMFYTPSGVMLTGAATGTDAFGKPQDFHRRIEKNLRAIQKEALKVTGPAPAYFLGAIVNIRFQRKASHVKTQILVGLNAAEVPFVQSTKEVSFSHLVIPKARQPQDAAVMSFNFDQVLKPDTAPTTRVEFGPLKGWQNRTGSLALKMYEDPRLSCHRRAQAVPYLRGVLGPKAISGTGMLAEKGRLLAQGKPVDFRIYDLNFDVEQSQVSDLNLAVGAGFHLGSYRVVLGCVNVESIDQKFEGEVNAALTQQVQRLQGQNPVSHILKILLSSQNGSPVAGGAQ